MTGFDIAMQAVSTEEGGYSNRAADPGGATNFGITHTTYDAWRVKHGLAPQDVKLISKLEEYAIYESEYWDVIKLDQVAALSLPLAVLMMDWAVQSGPGRAAVELQHLLGVLQDARIGPATLAAIQARLENEAIKGAAIGCHTLIADYAGLRAAFLVKWALRNPGNPGVLRRVPYLLHFIESIPGKIDGPVPGGTFPQSIPNSDTPTSA